MDDFPCPHCRSGHLVGGTCVTCGWSISIAAPDLPRPASPDAFSSADPSLACWFVLPVAAVFINFLGPSFSWVSASVFFGSLTAGAVAAQFGLLAIVGAVGPGRHAVRLIATFAVASGLLLVLIVGIALAERGGPSVSDIGGLFLVLPAVLLAAQAPLWVFRAFTGRWMWATTGSAAAPAGKTQFGVAQMMWATALIAVVIALARGGLVLWGLESDQVRTLDWARLTAICGGVAVASGAIAFPATAAVMIPRNPRGAIVLIFVYAILVTMAMLGIVKAIDGPVPVEVVAAIGLTSMATFGGILAGLGVIRNCGYSMVREGL
jgi:hypothetical protein